MFTFLTVAIRASSMAGWISIQIATLKKRKQINWLFEFGFWSPTKQAQSK